MSNTATAIERPQLVLPNESPKPMNIYQRLAAATAEMETVAKNLNVQTGKNGSYKAVSERDVIDAVKKVEAKHGIYSYPFSRRIIESEQLETETQYGKRTTFYLRVETVYRFVNIDKPEEYVDVTSYGDGMDSGDKATGKSMTYSDKFALMKAYKISTGDDPDQTASEEATYTKKAVKKEEKPEPKADTEEILPLIPDDTISAIHVQTISEVIARKGLNPKSITDYYKVKELKDLTMTQWMKAMKLLEKYKDIDNGTDGTN